MMTQTDKDDVEISIQNLLGSLLQSPSDPCICKAPEYMSKLSTCYEPSAVSIGPLYYNTKPSLRLFQEMKVRHLQSFLKLSNKDYGLGKYVDIVREHESRIRSCYEEKSSLSSNEYIEMVMIDAAFVIIFFMLFSKMFPNERHPIESRFEVRFKVHQDLFLVANQLPFFVLNELYDKAFKAEFPKVTFNDVTCKYIHSYFSYNREVENTICVSNIKHLVHLLRICWKPTKLHKSAFSGNEFLRKTAKELNSAGVKFRQSESRHLLDISFSKGVLKIPKLEVQDNTEVVLRSLAFFEQCHHSHDSYIIDYLVFIDSLIDTPEDVQILAKNGIIDNCLGSDEKVANLFNQINKDVILDNNRFYYGNLCRDLNAYADIRWNRWKTVLGRDYFNHPWSIISMIYLVVLLLLTVLQVYTGFKE